jgi:hypothetical protein
MRELDILYPIHREQFLKHIKKQSMLMDLGFDGEENIRKRKGRKPTKPNKNVETKPNTKLYASKGYWR